MIAYQSTLQALVPADTRDGAVASYDVLWNTARLLSLAAGGVLADVTDVRVVYVASAGLLFLAAAIGPTTKLDPPLPHRGRPPILLARSGAACNASSGSGAGVLVWSW